MTIGSPIVSELAWGIWKRTRMEGKRWNLMGYREDRIEEKRRKCKKNPGKRSGLYIAQIHM